jgi:hypothetical protein
MKDDERGGLPDIDALAGLTEAEQVAAATTELFNAHVKAGMPPIACAVMLGVMLATSGSQGQHGTDGS